MSAGLVMVRRGGGGIEILLAHPGGPFFRNRDDGAWTIPKGLVNPGEDLLAAACREFEEETGVPVRDATFAPLGSVRQKAGKLVHAWAFAGDCDPAALRSNTFEIEWPRRSGRLQVFPEIDRAAFFDPDTARRKILPAQEPFIDRALDAATLFFQP
ncbi:MAG TPA: NUDIX domain-containing protein [Haliangium sp.]|nr:NUDIX domain-containing protein [Haliangium sp.]